MKRFLKTLIRLTILHRTVEAETAKGDINEVI